MHPSQAGINPRRKAAAANKASAAFLTCMTVTITEVGAAAPSAPDI